MYQPPAPPPLNLELLVDQIRERGEDPGEYLFLVNPQDTYTLSSLPHTYVRTHWAIPVATATAVKQGIITGVGHDQAK